MMEYLDEMDILCSFCGKSDREVKKMIEGGSSVYICNECVQLCVEVQNKEDDCDLDIEDESFAKDLMEKVDILIKEAKELNGDLSTQ